MFKFSDYIYIETFRFERNVYVLNFIIRGCGRKGTLWMWARISVLILCVLRRKVWVRIKIDGCGWGQALEDGALLMSLGVQITIYSFTRFVISHGFYDRADTSKNVHIVLSYRNIQYCVTSVLCWRGD